MTALLLMVISGIFLSISFLLEGEYKKSQYTPNKQNYYFEAYTSMRVIAILEFIMGLIFYAKSPLPYVFPIETDTFKAVYHILIFLGCVILGSAIFQWIYEKFN